MTIRGRTFAVGERKKGRERSLTRTAGVRISIPPIDSSKARSPLSLRLKNSRHSFIFLAVLLRLPRLPVLLQRKRKLPQTFPSNVCSALFVPLFPLSRSLNESFSFSAFLRDRLCSSHFSSGFLLRIFPKRALLGLSAA